MSKLVTFSFDEALKKLGKSMDTLSKGMEAEFKRAVRDTAYAAYAAIQAQAQAKLNSTRQDYLSGLDIQPVGENSYLISLDGDWANKLEDGFASFDMTPGMLASQKTVGVGSRAGQPWVQKAKDDGHKFAYVPLEKKPFSKAGGNADMASAIRSMTATGANGVEQRITKIFNDSSGNAMEGLVARGKSDNPMLNNLNKYQKTYTDANGKKTTQSVYINYRVVSENGKPWTHPGFSGIHGMREAEKNIEANIFRIVKAFTGG